MLVGSPELKPETSVSQEIALLWDGQQGLNTGLTLFNTDFEDKISEIRRCESKSNPSCTLNGHTYDFISDRINVDKANMRGVEGTANWTINDAWSLASSYTFTQSEQKSGAMEGKPLNQMPRHMFNTTVDWQTTETVSLWSRVNFRSKTSDYLSRVKMAEGTPPTPSSTPVWSTRPTNTWMSPPVSTTCSTRRWITPASVPCWMVAATPWA